MRIDTYDWLAIGMQVVLLASVVVAELLRKNRRNMVALIIFATFLALYQAQALWMLGEFTGGLSRVRIFKQTISIEGFKTAIFYMTPCVLAMVASYWLSQRKGRPEKRQTEGKGRVLLPSYFLWMGGLVALAAGALMALGGGALGLLTQPGQALTGQTMMLVLLWLAKLPILEKLYNNVRLGWFDITLFAFGFGLTLLNSRFLAAFLLLQFLLAYHYGRREVGMKFLSLATAALLIIFLVFGVYRDTRWRAQGLTWQNFSTYATQFFSLDNDFNVLDWFFEFNIETYSGLSGIVTRHIESPHFEYDFGVSSLEFPLLFIPGAFREDPTLPFKDLRETIVSEYPYRDVTNVPSGAELAYGHGGAIGLGLFGAALGLMASGLDRRIRQGSSAGMLWMLLAVYPLVIVRGTFSTAVFFALCEVGVFYLWRLLVAATTRQREAQLAAA